MQGPILARLGRDRSGNPPPLEPSKPGFACYAGALGGEPVQAGSAAPDPPAAGSDSGPPKSRRNWRIAVLLALLGAAALWALHQHWRGAAFDWRTFAASFVHIRWQWIVAGSILGFATYYGRALRWAIMLEPLRPRPDVWGVFKATVIGFTAVVLLGRPGEFVRPYLISLKERVPLSSQFAAWFLERICDLLAVLLLFGFAVSQIRASGASLGPKFQWVLELGGYAVGILGLICLTILIMLGRFSGPMRKRLLDALSVLPARHHARTERIVTAFIEGTAATKTHGSAVKLTVYTILEWLLIVASFACLFKAYSVTAAFTLQDVLIFMGFVAFGSVLQIPGVGGGVQIVSIAVLTALYRVPLEVATAIAIMIWITTFVIAVPAGLLFAFKEGFNWRKIRELERRAVRAGSALHETGATGGPDNP